MRKSTSRGQGGMTLVEIMIAMGLVGVISLGIMSMMTQMNKAQLRSTAITQAQMLRQNFYEIVNNPVAWNNTVKDIINSNLACLRINADCVAEQDPEKPRPFVLKDPSDKIFYNGLDPTSGFSVGGTPCTAFPSDGCSFHVELSWKAFCQPNIPCLGPSIEVSGKVIYKPGTHDRVIAYNPANYSFKSIKQEQMVPVIAVPSPSGSPDASRDPASQGTQAPASANEQQINMICNALGPNINNPEAIAQIKAQMAGMGLSGAATSFIDNLPQTCASRAAGQ